MLKGIPSIITPEFLKILDEMGHGDVLVIGDANFPATSIAKAGKEVNIRCDGYGASAILDAVLSLIPLDTFVEKPVTIMDKMNMHKDLDCPIWREFSSIVEKYDDRGKDAIQFIDRFSFYEESKKAYAVVSTGEKALYACIMIQKGCL